MKVNASINRMIENDIHYKLQQLELKQSKISHIIHKSHH